MKNSNILRNQSFAHFFILILTFSCEIKFNYVLCISPYLGLKLPTKGTHQIHLKMNLN